MRRREVAPEPKLEAAVMSTDVGRKVTIVPCTIPFSFKLERTSFANWARSALEGKKKTLVFPCEGFRGSDMQWLLRVGQDSTICAGGEVGVNQELRKSVELTNRMARCGTRLPDEALEKIRRDLFPHVTKLRPRFEKLVIYTEGSFVAAHEDAPRGATHVGTLLLLPKMEYQGGSLHIDGRLVASWGSQSSFVAFPCRVVHEVQPVTVGVRIAAVFSLWHQGIKIPRQVRSEKRREVLQALEDVATRERPPAGIVIRMEGTYTVEQLEGRSWAASDALLYACLVEATFHEPRVVPVHVGDYDFTVPWATNPEAAQYYWLSRHTHFDVPCGCAKEAYEIPSPNVIDVSKVLLVNFRELSGANLVGETPFYDLGTSLSAFRHCAFVVPTADLLRGKNLRNFLSVSYRGTGSIFARMRTEQRDLWILLGTTYM
jgi:hypothetical protein